jgi:hypothetical protein
MLEVSMLQSLELINSVETPNFSTESVENNAGRFDHENKWNGAESL